MGALYFGDKMDVLREEIRDDAIDLIYLDPPFNSKRDYNVFLKTPKGHESDAQITAFEDTWHWGEQAEREFSELLEKKLGLQCVKEYNNTGSKAKNGLIDNFKALINADGKR